MRGRGCGGGRGTGWGRGRERGVRKLDCGRGLLVMVMGSLEGTGWPGEGELTCRLWLWERWRRIELAGRVAR